MDDLTRVYETTMLLDFYGSLLTQKQQEIMYMHCNDDYSLSEISEVLHISRQGVYDNIRRAKISLRAYEKKLGLVEKFDTIKATIAEDVNRIKEMDLNILPDKDRKILANVCADLGKIKDLY